MMIIVGLNRRLVDLKGCADVIVSPPDPLANRNCGWPGIWRGFLLLFVSLAFS